MAHIHVHTKDRRVAAQVLYSGAIRGARASELLRAGDIECIDGVVSDYVISLIDGIEANQAELDAMIDEASTNWSIDRMPIMDLAVLRIALFEMLHVDSVPVSVAIDEAVELAKYFGGDEDSPKFINGLLGHIARESDMGVSESADNTQLANDAQPVDAAQPSDDAQSTEVA
jgi:N utilization substance protein B